MNKNNSRPGRADSLFEKSTPTKLHAINHKSESIVHRLNNLSVLINSSYIDLNIAFNEGEDSFSNNAKHRFEVKATVDSKSGKLASLASQSKKRRSLLPDSRPNNLSINSTTDEQKSLTGGGAYFGRDGLIDAFLALYEECCSNEQYKSDPLIQEFIKRYGSYVSHLHKLCVGLDDFECLNVIGKGHFAVVKLVKEKTTSQFYALKTLKKNDTLHQKHVAFYEEERDIMAKATSPWITKLQYAFQDAQNLYLVMDYHPGGDLLSLLERSPDGKLPEKSVCFYLSQTATGLNHLHNMGYVHRDIKPENLLLDRCGHIKLADFGSACKLGTNGLVTAQMPAGTPDYLAPEVLTVMEAKKTVGYGVLCDFWSLGVVAYEMLYGKTPFLSAKVSETYSNIMQHKTRLKFPEDESVSKEAITLIKSLLVEDGKRLKYKEIVKHAFFLHTNWNSLLDAVPPFIPVINGADDISNFESFDDSPPTPVSTKGGTSSRANDTTLGKKVPFVGFTYSRPVVNALKSTKIFSLSDEGANSEAVVKLQQELKEKRKTIHVLEMKTKGQESNEKKIEDKQKVKLIQIEKEKKKLQDQVITMEGSLATLKKQLSSEKAERATMESKTVSLVKDIKTKWKKEEEEKISQIAEKCELLEEAAHKEREAHSETLVKHKECLVEINALEKQLLQYRRLAHAKDKEVKKLEAAASAMEGQMNSMNTTSSVDEEQFRVIKEEMNKVAKNLTEVKAERNELKQKVKEYEEKCLKQESEIDLMKSQLDSMETKSFEDIERINAMHHEALSVKESLVRELKSSLESEKKEKKSLYTQIDSANEKLATRLNSFEKEFDKIVKRKDLERSELEGKMQDLTRSLEDKERIISEVRVTKDNLQRRVSSLEVENKTLESSQILERSRVSDVDSRLSSELDRVKEQLEGAKEALVREEERNKVTLRDLNQEKKTVSELQLDKRLVSKDLQDAKEKIAFLRECYRESREESKTHMGNMKSKDEEIQKLEGEKACVESRLKESGRKAEEVAASHAATVAALNTRISDLETTIKEKEGLSKKLRDAHVTIDQSKLTKRGVESKLEQAEQSLVKAEEVGERLKAEVKTLSEKICSLEKSNGQLKELCSDLDEQLSELEVIEKNMQEQEDNKKTLEEKIAKLELEVKAARTQVNEEKSLKMFQERQVKTLQSQLKGAEEQTDRQVTVLQTDVEQCAQENLTLSDKISILEKKLQESERVMMTLEDQCECLKMDVDHLHEQSAGHISHIHELKDSNYQLTQGLEEAINKGAKYKKKVEELTQEMEQERQIACDRDLRNKMTLEQQAKLIDFLQAKLDDKNLKRKKTLSSKLFGGGTRDKENNPDIMTPYKTRSNLLQQEAATPITTRSAARSTSKMREPCSMETPFKRTVSVERCKMYKTSENTPSVKQTPAKESSSSVKQTPAKEKQRIRHNIPHRFERTMLVHGGRCSGCQSTLTRGRFGYKCSHCSAMAHKHCFPGVPSTCGLPQELALHFSRDETSSSGDVVHDGWVKIEMKGAWEFCYACLNATGDLLLYNHEPSEEDSISPPPQHTFSLLSEKARVEVVTSVPRGEVPPTSPLDLPFVIKVEAVRGALQCVQRVYLMTTNYDQKQRWVAALEHTLYTNTSPGSEEGGAVEVKELVTLSGRGKEGVPTSSPNCLHYINQKTALLGAAEGLFCCSVSTDGSLLKKARLGTLSDVHQILDVPSVQHVLCIAGATKQTFLFPYATLHSAATNCTLDEASVPHTEVSALNTVCCHLLAKGVTSDKRTFVCAAAQDRICILLWNQTSSSLEMVRQYGTQEPCTSCLFTPAALIVAADKLYEIDLNTFTIEEFLDESDTSLAYAIYGTTHIDSYPMSVLQISESGKYREFLVVFNEFGLFVDPYGQRSREHDIKFTRMPLDVVYVKGILYLIFSNAVEAIEIRGDSFTKVTSSESQDFDASSTVSCTSHRSTLKLPNPEVMGTTLDDCLAVSVESRVEEEWKILRLNTCFPPPDELSSWSSLPSTIRPPAEKQISNDDSETSGTYSISDTEGAASLSAKRKMAETGSTSASKHVHFTPKRQKRDGK